MNSPNSPEMKIANALMFCVSDNIATIGASLEELIRFDAACEDGTLLDFTNAVEEMREFAEKILVASNAIMGVCSVVSALALQEAREREKAAAE